MNFEIYFTYFIEHLRANGSILFRPLSDFISDTKAPTVFLQLHTDSLPQGTLPKQSLFDLQTNKNLLQLITSLEIFCETACLEKVKTFQGICKWWRPVLIKL